jgi:UDP-N-acetyl-2-amino-2-deoxyglucuronate dehydrogenase
VVDDLRFGFVGAGEIAVASAEAVRDAEHASLVSVFDVEPALAADLVGRFGGRSAGSLEQLLADPMVDAVYVCVPHHLHREMAVRAAASGKHVLVEKPMGVSVDDAEAIVAACEASGVRCGVAFVVREAPAFAAAHRLVDAGEIGDVTGFRITYRGDKPASYWTGGWSGRATGDWRMHRSSAGGGVLIMNAIHDLDAIMWITGLEIERVHAASATTSGTGDVEDVALAILEASGGALGSVEALAALPGGEGPGVRWIDRIHGTDGQILLPTPWGEDEPALFRRATGEWTEVPSGMSGGDARARTFERFASAVLRGDEPPIPGRDGVRASRLVHAIYAAARSGGAVEVGSGRGEPTAGV